MKLYEAARDGDIEEVKRQLKGGVFKKKANLEEIDINNNTALIHAAWQGRLEIVEILLAAGANVHHVGWSGYTPLKLANEKNFHAIAELLTEAIKKSTTTAAKISTACPAPELSMPTTTQVATRPATVDNSSAGGTGLSLSSILSGREVAFPGSSLFSSRQADEENFNKVAVTIESDNSEALQKLLADGIDANTKNRENLTILALAIAKEKTWAVQCLLNNGAKANTQDSHGMSPLFSAVVLGNIEIIKMLLKADADVNEVSPEGLTPLMLTAAPNLQEIAESVPEVGRSGLSVGEYYNLELCRDISVQSEVERKCHELLKVMDLLIAHGADVNKSCNGLTPLMQATVGNNLSAMLVLLAAGARIDERNIEGKTACMMAAEHRNSHALEILLAAGAKKDVKDRSGLTVEALARRSCDLSTLAVLSRADGMKTFSIIGDIDFRGNKLLFANIICQSLNLEDKRAVLLGAAIALGCNEIVKRQLEAKVDVNIKFKNGYTALHLAALCGNEKIVGLLLEAGAKDMPTEKEMNTALMFAAERGHVQIVLSLLAVGSDPKIKATNGKCAEDIILSNPRLRGSFLKAMGIRQEDIEDVDQANFRKAVGASGFLCGTCTLLVGVYAVSVVAGKLLGAFSNQSPYQPEL
ncbi:MAG: hypothetical protein K0R66_1644 [Gammaproteobacteria bacterium]|jgi:ankyrin repeat protein|nr:hypothetical protein [Gammaproteobacteria bacterium]